MKPLSAMVFAAGFGTRMAPLTDTQPKPLIKVAGVPLIDYALDLLEEQKLQTTIVNTHYFPEQIEEHLTTRHDVHCLYEKHILETGGGLKNALPLLGQDPVLTLNSDVIFVGDNPIELLQQAWKPEIMDALLILIPKEQAIGHSGAGDFLRHEDGRLERRGAKDTAPFIYGSAQILKTTQLNSIEESAFSLNVLWNKMLSDGRVYGLPYTGKWVDVGTPQSIALAEKELAHV